MTMTSISQGLLSPAVSRLWMLTAGKVTAPVPPGARATRTMAERATTQSGAAHTEHAHGPASVDLSL